MIQAQIIKCRLCHRPAAPTAAKADVALYRCPDCGFVSGLPLGVHGQHYAETYSAEQPPAPSSRYEQWLRQAEDRTGRGRLLEVGAGSGGFVRVALARGWKVDATEASRSAAQRLQETGAVVHRCDVEEAGFGAGLFDLVVSLEVLEHLPQPQEHLRELRRVTRPGGWLLLTTPNFDGLSRRRLGISWRVVAAEHLGYFTPGTLRAALLAAGYVHARVGSRSLDVLSWRRGATAGRSPAFDPHRSARLRDDVERSSWLRSLKEAAHGVLRATGLGDSLLAWAQRQ